MNSDAAINNLGKLKSVLQGRNMERAKLKNSVEAWARKCDELGLVIVKKDREILTLQGSVQQAIEGETAVTKEKITLQNTVSKLLRRNEYLAKMANNNSYFILDLILKWQSKLSQWYASLRS